jgi:hypothetical protein
MRAQIILTLKQHRFETIAAVVLCVGVALAALVEAFRLNSIQFPAGCLVAGQGVPYFDPSMPPTPCTLASAKFHGLDSGFDMNLVKLFEQILPFIVGIMFGAVLVSREIEQGTAPLSWALAGSRRRWLTGKLVAVVLLIVPLLLVAGLAADMRQGALLPGSDPHASFEYYADRGVFFVFWGLAALCGTVALGTLSGRTLPAVMVALVVCVFVRGSWMQVWNRTVLREFAVANDPVNYSRADLWVYQGDQLYLDGKPWYGDINAWWNAQQTCVQVSPDPNLPGSLGGTMCQMNIAANAAPPMPPMQLTYVIHGDRYWPIVALESAALLAGAAFCAAVALFWVGRRRPY